MKSQEDKLEHLHAAIECLPGKEWNDKVIYCADLLGRHRYTVYRWLTPKAKEHRPIPDIVLTALKLLVKDLPADDEQTNSDSLNSDLPDLEPPRWKCSQ